MPLAVVYIAGAYITDSAGAWFIHWPVRLVWPVHGLYRPGCVVSCRSVR